MDILLALLAHDDTETLQDKFDNQAIVRIDKTYRHNDILYINKPIKIVGNGRIIATNPKRSAIFVNANNVTIDNVTFAANNVDKRYVAYEQMKLRIKGNNATLNNIKIRRSAAAGIYVQGDDFKITKARISRTQADGIYITEGARNGLVEHSRAIKTGDDGFAVVSYASSAPVQNITLNKLYVKNQTWGRGISVVGGNNIRINNCTTIRTAGAGLYIASEQEWRTHGVNNVTVNRCTLNNSNVNPNIGHAAIVFYNSTGKSINNITMKKIKFINNKSIKIDGPIGNNIKINKTIY